MTRSNRDFHNLRFELNNDHPTSHTLEAFSGNTDEFLGAMRWDKGSGHMYDIGVDAPYRRQGVATAMWAHAQQLAASNEDISTPKHSPVRTADGMAWSESVGAEPPVFPGSAVTRG
jgi:GNAT superfamily N-acetyltransferase